MQSQKLPRVSIGVLRIQALEQKITRLETQDVTRLTKKEVKQVVCVYVRRRQNKDWEAVEKNNPRSV